MCPSITGCGSCSQRPPSGNLFRGPLSDDLGPPLHSRGTRVALESPETGCWRVGEGCAKSHFLAARWDRLCSAISVLENHKKVTKARLLEPHPCLFSLSSLPCFPHPLTGFSWKHSLHKKLTKKRKTKQTNKNNKQQQQQNKNTSLPQALLPENPI